MELKVPPPVYMFIYGFLMWVLSNMWPVVSWNIVFSESVGIVLVGLGFAIELWCFAGFMKSKTTINPLSPDKASSLVTGGLYQYTRNPMYLGMLLTLGGWGLYLACLSGFIFLPAFIWTMNKFQIKPEERILSGLFGKEYAEYKASVGRWV